jgi:hypothetical protein
MTPLPDPGVRHDELLACLHDAGPDLNKTSATMDNCLDFVWSADTNQADIILELVRSKGVLRTRDVDSASVSRALLASLTDKGKVLKLGCSLYVLPDRAASQGLQPCRRARIQSTAHCSTSLLIQADDLPLSFTGLGKSPFFIAS